MTKAKGIFMILTNLACGLVVLYAAMSRLIPWPSDPVIGMALIALLVIGMLPIAIAYVGIRVEFFDEPISKP